MKNLNFKRDIMPHLVAIGVFLILTIGFYSPLFFQNKEIYQNDILQGAGANTEIIEYRDNNDGEQALWTNSMFSGMPSYLISMDWKDDVIWTVQKIITFNLPSSARETYLMMLCFYIMALTFGVRPWVAILGAIAFAFNTYNIGSIEAGHIWKVRAIAYGPLIIAGFRLLFVKKHVLGGLLLSIAFTLSLLANHPQITYYIGLIILIYGLFHLYEKIKEKDWKHLAYIIPIGLISVLIGIGANAGRLLTTLEYSSYSIRGERVIPAADEVPGESGLDKEYAFSYSSGVFENLTLIIPNFYGGASVQNLKKESKLEQALRRQGAQPQQIKQYTERAPTYFGDQPFVASPTYAGAVTMFLFTLGILFTSKKEKTWVIVAIVFSVFLAMGKNFQAFNYLIFDYFPGYNKFRAVSMTINMALLLIPLMGIIGLENTLNIKKGWNKKLLIAIGIPAGFALIFILFAGLFSYTSSVDSNFPDWFKNAIMEDRLELRRGDAIRSFILILFAGGLLYIHKNSKVNSIILFIGIGALITIDLMGVDFRYLNDNNYVRNKQTTNPDPSPADRRIMQETAAHYRVLNLSNPFNEASTSFFHKSLGGYHGAKMRRYQDLIERHISPELNSIITKLQSGSTSLPPTPVINMLNAKYFKAGEQANAVISNSGSMGNAWLVDSIMVIPDQEEQIELLDDVNLQRIALLDTDLSYDPVSIGNIRLTSYSPNVIKYNANTEGKAFAVFSEIWYPEGWQATINGKEAAISKVNYTLRGLELPQGNSDITFTFAPSSVKTGNTLVIIFSFVFLSALLGLISYPFIFNKN